MLQSSYHCKQDWESAAGMARALSIGQKESQALFALTNDIPVEIVTELEHAVKVRGMSRFMNHDVIGKGTFSTGWSSGSGPAESWSDVLTNLPGNDTLATHLKSDDFFLLTML